MFIELKIYSKKNKYTLYCDHYGCLTWELMQDVLSNTMMRYNMMQSIIELKQRYLIECENYKCEDVDWIFFKNEAAAQDFIDYYTALCIEYKLCSKNKYNICNQF